MRRGSSWLLWCFVLFAWAWFCLGCVEPLPLPKGSETCPLQVILLFAFLLLSIACWSFFVRFFNFSFFLSDYQMCVLSMHSSRGRLRTMCGSRTSGWSLPGVMSDWQRYVDWFLAKYCRCRLRLDSWWCRWKGSAKGRCRWGLQV
jgi:bacteriorhodopsin